MSSRSVGLIEKHRQNHPDDIIESAIELATRWEESTVRGGQSPRGVAAACVYASYLKERGRGEVGQTEIADEFDVTKVTIRQRLKELR